MARGPLRTIGRDVCFCHWPIDPDELRPRVPDALSIDAFDGRAWVSALAIRDVRATARGVPAERSGPGLIVRTYVAHGDDRGVFFLALDTEDRPGTVVGGRVLGLPISRTRIDAERRRNAFMFRSRRRGLGNPASTTRFRARYRPTGPTFRPEPGSLEAFLTDRSRFFVASDRRSRGRRSGGRRSGKEKLRVGEIARTDWRLRDVNATVEAGGLFGAVGLDAPSAEPHCYYSEGFRIDTGRPRPIERSDYRSSV
jgi:uncharacterized protein YqjF (DUF2071 family)